MIDSKSNSGTLHGNEKKKKNTQQTNGNKVDHFRGEKAKTQHMKGKNNGTISGKEKKTSNKQVVTMETTSGKKEKKKRQQKQTKTNTDKGATTVGPLQTKRKPINK